ncbi:hypothetical protein PR202_gb12200 [Eleusine coracana subsp. coracana]|uniref:Uncharacterized protein n=1 Tax=Eleusine coracana subsp. coracana TaxID=191504 RepID=A0AAV5EQE0_ELECO|nr:hypothetical protein QOZ80_7BG0586030 [Eleusine coracana subsp. coracana]GJN24460.1 hypothetical protein PR202_gb12200 [Eleusine coracana subsp. coracana]
MSTPEFVLLPKRPPPAPHCSKMSIASFSEARKTVANGNCILSDPVVAGGRSWRVAFFPNGKHPGTTDAVSLYLVFNDDDGHDDDHKDGHDDDEIHYSVNLRFKLYDGAGGGGSSSPLFTSADLAGFFSTRSVSAQGFERFVTLKDLEESGVLKRDCFTIGCELTILRKTIITKRPMHMWGKSSLASVRPEKSSVQAPSESSLPEPSSAINQVPSSHHQSSLPELTSTVKMPPPPPFLSGPASAMEVNVPSESSELYADLGRLLETKQGADVRFEVGGKAFAAHKLVLAARSPLYKAAFFGPRCETATHSRIRIPDMDPRTFEAVLHYMYTDTLPEMEHDEEGVLALDLLVAADKYSLEGLKSMTEDELCGYVNASRVFKMLAVAERYQCPKLKSVCLELIGSRKITSAIMVSEDVENLARSCPSVVKEVIGKVLDAREETPCDSLVSGIDCDLLNFCFVLIIAACAGAITFWVLHGFIF